MEWKQQNKAYMFAISLVDSKLGNLFEAYWRLDTFELWFEVSLQTFSLNYVVDYILVEMLAYVALVFLSI